MFKIYDGRETFYQWDQNQKLIVEDATIDEVHFCNKTEDCALIVKVYEEGGFRVADVPNILLTDNFTIRAYAYCGGCYTKQEAAFKVVKRSKPSDYVYTETDVITIEKIVEDTLANTEELVVNNLIAKDYIAAKEGYFGENDEIVLDANGIAMREGATLTIGGEDALEGKLDKITTTAPYNRAYVVGYDGKQTTVVMNQVPTPWILSCYDGDKCLSTNTPTQDAHCANKQYVDDITGDIEQALDAILAIQKELLPPPIIDFIIDWGADFYLNAIEGMTWKEWIDSEYNTAEVFDNGGSVGISVCGLYDSNGNWQYIDTVIIANMTYVAS